MNNKTDDLTWDDILGDLEAAIKENKCADDPVKLAKIKQKFIDHLNTLEKEPVDCGVINVVSRWADIINEKAVDFHNERGVYPNILLAHTQTFDRIDKYLKKHPENLAWGGFGEAPEFDGLSCFTGDKYHLEFCIDTEMGKNAFRLVYDESPSFDGEESQELKKQQKTFIFKMTA